MDQAVSSGAGIPSAGAANVQQAMHEGVIRDMEQQRVKQERQLDFDRQRLLEEELRKVQPVSTMSTDAALSKRPGG